MKEISVTEFKDIIDNDDIFLLDVRTNDEFKFVNIGGTNIPLDQVSSKLSDIPKDKNIYCLCHHGMRSAHACMTLFSSSGIEATNINGGIDAWSNFVDPNVRKY